MITGITSDVLVKSRMVDYAKDLSPVQDNDGRLAYASLLLAWVLQGETERIRLVRTKALEQTYQSHLSDRCWGVNHGPRTDVSIPYPDFMIEVQKFLEFLS